MSNKQFLVDIVNFNADASLLSYENWHKYLLGKKKSKFCEWLNIYIKNKKKISLGLTGSTILDLLIYNPDALDLINNHENIFQIIYRPFSHDISVYRTDHGFSYNLKLGKKIINDNFKNIAKFYLPPEFFVNFTQLKLIEENLKIKNIFISNDRSKLKKFKNENFGYIKTPFNSKLNLINLSTKQSTIFYSCLHNQNFKKWNQFNTNKKNFLFWRDGETSAIFNSNKLENKLILKEEMINRVFLEEIISKKSFQKELDMNLSDVKYWFDDGKFFKFFSDIYDYEKNIFYSKDKNFPESIFIWLNLINSDIFSSQIKDHIIINEKIFKRKNKMFYFEFLNYYKEDSLYQKSNDFPFQIHLFKRYQYLLNNHYFKI